MPELPCSVVRDMLDLFLDGEVGPETRRMVNEHLEECPTCQSVFEARQRVLQAVERAKSCETESFNGARGQGSRILARARRRFLARLGAGTGVVLFLLATLLGSIWYFSRPAGTGLYLARMAASQVTVNPGYRLEMTLPFLWVPAWPGQSPPEMTAAVLEFEDGSQEQLLAVWRPQPGTSLFARSQPQTVWLFDSRQGSTRTETTVGTPPVTSKKVASITLLGQNNEVLAYTTELDLTVVWVNSTQTEDPTTAPWVSGFYIRSKDGRLAYDLKVTEPVELADLVLPECYYPLSIETASGDSILRTVFPDNSSSGGEGSRPLTFPQTLEPGAYTIVTAATNQSKGYVTIFPVMLVQSGGEILAVSLGGQGFALPPGLERLDLLYNLDSSCWNKQ